MFRVIIAGGRDMNDYLFVQHHAERLLHRLYEEKEEVVIVSGGAKGADHAGEFYAKNKGLVCMTYPADWDTHGRSAGYKRNLLMAENADALIAFWDGESRGTGHMIDIARQKGLSVRVIRYEGKVSRL